MGRLYIIITKAKNKKYNVLEDGIIQYGEYLIKFP